MSDFNIPPIDINTAIASAMNFEYKQQYRLQVSQNTNDVQLSVYSSLKNVISDFQKKLTSLQTAFNGIQFEATASDATVLSNITINNNNVSDITHSVVVTQLAQSQIMNSGYFSDSKAALNTNETLSIQDNNNHQMNISIANTDTLENIKAKINNNTFGLKADIIASTDNDGNNRYHLVITTASGAKNQINITGDNANLFQFSQAASAKDALFTFDGHDVVRSSNTISDVLDGISFRIDKIGSSNISIAKNTSKLKDGIKTAVSDMVNSYNQLINFLSANQVVSTYNKNDDTYDIQKNNDFELIKSKIMSAMNGAFSGNISSLYTIGIKIDKDSKMVTDNYDQRPAGSKSSAYAYGNLKLDDTQLDDYLTNHFEDIKSLLTNSTTGLVSMMNTRIDDTIMKQTKGTVIYDTMEYIQRRSDKNKEKIDDQTDRMNKMHDDLIDRFTKINMAIEKYRTINNYLTIQFESFRNNK